MWEQGAGGCPLIRSTCPESPEGVYAFLCTSSGEVSFVPLLIEAMALQHLILHKQAKGSHDWKGDT